jgi:hypothetical protein
MNGAMPKPIAACVALVRRGLVWAAIAALGGCVTDTKNTLSAPPPYMLLPADEMMSCDAIAASFQFSARRAARLEYWLFQNRSPGYGNGEFPVEGPKELMDERRRLDALSDLQRFKGCYVLDPAAAVVYERSKLEGPSKSPKAPVVLNSKG